MSSSRLTTQPTAGVLQRLLIDAEGSRLDLARIRGEGGVKTVPPQSPEFWSQFRDFHLAIAPETGRLLYLLARATHARTIVEFGTSFGVSTIYLAAAVADNGGGLVIGTELEPTKAAATRRTLTEAGLGQMAEVREGDALETLRAGLPGPVDLVLLDGAKELYLTVLHLLEPSLAPNAMLVADNAGRSPEYLGYVRDGGGYFSVPGTGQDVEISLRLG